MWRDRAPESPLERAAPRKVVSKAAADMEPSSGQGTARIIRTHERRTSRRHRRRARRRADLGQVALTVEIADGHVVRRLLPNGAQESATRGTADASAAGRSPMPARASASRAYAVALAC